MYYSGLACARVGHSLRTRQLTSIDRSVWRSTLILSAWSCWLMWGTYYEIHHGCNDTGDPTAQVLMVLCLCSYHFPRPVAPAHNASAQRPPTRVQRRTCGVEWHVLSTRAIGNIWSLLRRFLHCFEIVGMGYALHGFELRTFWSVALRKDEQWW
jgi:hypothetical protein